MPEPPSLTVRFFATARDLTGCQSVTIAPGPGLATVSDLLAWLAHEYPPLADRTGSLLVSRNCRYAGPDEPLAPGDEVAVFPPVSGG